VDRFQTATARVTVNRFWQMPVSVQASLKTVEDFGSQGEWPLHAELLERGWPLISWTALDIKGTLKKIVNEPDLTANFFRGDS